MKRIILLLSLIGTSVFSQTLDGCDITCQTNLLEYRDWLKAQSDDGAVPAFSNENSVKIDNHGSVYSIEDAFRKPIQKGPHTRGLEIRREIESLDIWKGNSNIYRK